MKKHIIIWIAIIIVFAIVSWAAYIIRGYRAIGGEIVILLVPLLYYIGKVYICYQLRK